MSASSNDAAHGEPRDEPSGESRDEPRWDDESAIFQRTQSAHPPSDSANARPRDDEALAAIFSQYHRYVAKIGRRILGTSADVDDLIQDVFLATVKDIDKVRDPDKLRGWLATVATRMARKRRTKSARRESLAPADPDEIVRMPSEAPSPESTADLSGKVRHVLNLPEELRTPWVLKHVEGHTLESVAERCEISMSTAQRRIQAAAGRLARKR